MRKHGLKFENKDDEKVLKSIKENVKDYMNKNGYKFSTAIDEKRFNNYNEVMTVNIERK